MIDVTIKLCDATYNKLTCDAGIEQDLYDYFTFKVPNYEFMKRKNPKLKHWSGDIHLYSKKTKKLYVGLTSRLYKFAEARQLTIQNNTHGDTEFSALEAKELIARLNLPETLVPRYYQFKSFLQAVRKRRVLILSPTSSGKSLFLYMLIRYYMEQGAKKILLIVPTINLIHQMYSDFQSYKFDVYEHVHQIYAGQELTSDKPVWLTTWQSIYNQPKEYFNDVDAIFVDESHHAQADSIKHIMENAVNTHIRVGCTGTLDDSLTHRLVLEGLFGDIYQSITTTDLIKEGFAAKLKIKAIVLKHSNTACRLANSFDYADEIEFLALNRSRNRFIKNLALSLDNNVLILFKLIDKHGKILYDEIRASTSRHVYYIHGGTEGQERERIRQILLKEENAILVGSYGTVSTGINWPSLNSIIAASPYKSRIKVLQSIGRGLRLDEEKGKVTCTWFDLSDDLTYKGRPNTTLEHFNSRMEIYYTENFKPKIYRVELK